MKKICLLLFLSISVLIQAQNKLILKAINDYNYENAIALIDKESTSNELEVLKASCYKNLLKYDSAIKILESVVESDSSNINALTSLADSYESIGKFNKSLSIYNKCMSKYPDNRYFHLKYINSLYKSKNWDETITKIKKHLETDTIYPLYTLLGDSYWQTDSIDAAIKSYNKGIEYNPEDYNLVYKLAKIYLQKEEYSKLIICTNNYIAIDSTNKVINQYNGIGYCFDHQFEKAIIQLNKLYNDGDKSYTTNYFLGASHFGTQDYYPAYEHLSEAYRQDSTNLNLIFYLGSSSISSGKFDTGISVLNRGLELMIPKDSVLFNFHSNLALAYTRNKRYNEAIISHELCYKLKPEAKLPLYSIALIYDYDLKVPKQALKYYQLFLSKFPPEPETNKEEFKDEMSGTYYSAVKNRIEELKTEQFFKK